MKSPRVDQLSPWAAQLYQDINKDSALEAANPAVDTGRLAPEWEILTATDSTLVVFQPFQAGSLIVTFVRAQGSTSAFAPVAPPLQKGRTPWG